MYIKTMIQRLMNFLQKYWKFMNVVYKNYLWKYLKLRWKNHDDVFDIIEYPYRLRNLLRFKSRNICTVRYGIETAAFVVSWIWIYMASELKKCKSLNRSRSKKKAWKSENCSCKLCKIFLQRIGYLQVVTEDVKYILLDIVICVSLFMKEP